MNRNYKKLLVIGLCIVVVVWLCHYLGIQHYFTLEHLKNNRQYLTDLVTHYPGWSALAYVALCAGIVACGIPVIGPLTVVGGFLFGTFFGTLYSLTGSTVGVIGMVLFVRYVIAQTIAKRYGNKLATFNKRLQAYGHSYLLTMNLLAVIPFFVIATLAGLADVSLITVVWTTIVGSFPLIFIYAFAGRQLGTISSIGDIFSPQIIAAFVLLALLALIPMVIRRVREITDI